MRADRSSLFYQCTFLYVSFQAIHQSIGGAEDDAKPCWLDTGLLKMFASELHDARQQAAHVPAITESLDMALYHCNLLLAHCPGAMHASFCREHLNGTMQALKATTQSLSMPPAAASSSGPGWSRTMSRWLTRWRQH